jgi:hypothetical protein
MGSKDPVPDVEQWWPFPWEKPDPISQDDIDDIQADIDAMLHKQKQ